MFEECRADGYVRLSLAASSTRSTILKRMGWQDGWVVEESLGMTGDVQCSKVGNNKRMLTSIVT